MSEREYSVPSLRTVLGAFSGLGGNSAKRDKGVPRGLFAMPLAIMVIIGIAISGYSSPSLMVGVLNPDSPDATRFVAALEADTHVSVRPYVDVERMRIAVYRGRLHAGIMFPPGWTLEQDLPMVVSPCCSC